VLTKKAVSCAVSCAVPMSTVATSAMSLAVNLEPIWSTCKKMHLKTMQFVFSPHATHSKYFDAAKHL
jgi:hypothetical protein